MMNFALITHEQFQSLLDKVTFESVVAFFLAGFIASILTLFDLDEVFYVPRKTQGTTFGKRFWIKSALNFWWYGFIISNGLLAGILFLLLRESEFSNRNIYGAAVMAGFGYLVLVRMKITTVNEVPIGLELVYEKAKKYAYKRINRIVTEARKEELAQMVQAKKLKEMINDVWLALQTDALLSDEDRASIKTWIKSVEDDKQLTEYEKQLFIGNFLLSGNRPNS